MCFMGRKICPVLWKRGEGNGTGTSESNTYGIDTSEEKAGYCQKGP